MKTRKIKTIYKVFALAMLAFFVKFAPFVQAFALTVSADTTAAGSSSTMTKVVKWAAAVIGGIVAILLMVSIAKDAIQYAKGGGSVSIPKIIGKVIFMLIMIAIVFVAANYQTAADTGAELANKGMNTISTALDEAGVGGGGGSTPAGGGKTPSKP